MASNMPNEISLQRDGEDAISMTSAVSNDALVHILLKLPVKSLLRCRGVCKSWCSLISSPDFISVHRKHVASSGDSRTIIIRRCDRGTRKLRYSLHYDDESLMQIAEFEFPTPSPSCFPRILGSVNGLICLFKDGSSLMLWNPAIRKSLNVDLTSPRPAYLGFGYDPLADDYKIVSVVSGSGEPCVDIYRLSALSWSRIDLHGEISTLPSLFPRQAYLNGVVHWLAHDSRIIGFDLRTETFTVINLPGDLHDKKMEDVDIAAWCGSLALFELDSSKSICLWVMNEYGVVDSWNRQCLISNLSFPQRIRGIARNGKILVEDFFALLFWFDPVTQRIENLTIQDIGDVSMFHVKPHTESLVMLDVRDESIPLEPQELLDDEGSAARGKKIRVY